MVKHNPVEKVGESLEALALPSFRDVCSDIPVWMREGVDKYFNSCVSGNNSTTDDSKDADICRSVIEEVLKKKFGEKILDQISSTPRDRIFKKLNNDGKVEFEGLLGVTEDNFSAACVAQYCREYLRPRFLTENKKTSDGHFVIHYSDGLSEKTLSDIEQELRTSFDDICNFFLLSKEEKEKLVTDIYIYNEQEFFHLCALGAKGREWLVGYSNEYGIQIVNPEIIEAFSFTYESQIHCLSHEFVHTVTFLDGEERPIWLIEGIAQYLVPYQKPKKKSLQELLSRCPLNEETLSMVFGKDTQGFAAYGGYKYSYTIIDYIINSYEEGKKKMQEILKNPKRKLPEILGVSEDEFKKGWIRYVEDYIKN